MDLSASANHSIQAVYTAREFARLSPDRNRASTVSCMNSCNLATPRLLSSISSGKFTAGSNIPIANIAVS